MDSRRRFGTVLCAIFVLSTSAAVVLGQNDPAAERAMTGNGEGSLPSFSETTVDPSQSAGGCDAELRPIGVVPDGPPRPISSSWIGSAAFLTRSWRRCRARQDKDLRKTTGTEVLGATDLQQGFSGGPRLGLIHHGDDGTDLEVSYFQIDGWNNARSIGPIIGPDGRRRLARDEGPGQLSANSTVRRSINDVGLCFATLQCRGEHAMESLAAA